MFLRAIEILGAVLAVAAIVTQVIVPLWRETKLFPMLRRRKVARELVAAREDLEVAKDEFQAAQLRKRAGDARPK